MKIFEKKIMSDQNHELSKVSTESLLNRRDVVFALPASDAEKKSQAASEFANNVKKTLQTNINRIDLLTDAKIGDIKGLMKTMTD